MNNIVTIKRQKPNKHNVSLGNDWLSPAVEAPISGRHKKHGNFNCPVQNQRQWNIIEHRYGIILCRTETSPKKHSNDTTTNGRTEGQSVFHLVNEKVRIVHIHGAFVIVNSLRIIDVCARCVPTYTLYTEHTENLKPKRILSEIGTASWGKRCTIHGVKWKHGHNHSLEQLHCIPTDFWGMFTRCRYVDGCIECIDICVKWLCACASVCVRVHSVQMCEWWTTWHYHW